MRHGWLLAQMRSGRGVECYVCTEGTAIGWRREYNGVAVMLTILQSTEEDSNGVAGI
ncbi:hypothetical protein G1O98_24285 [Nostoc sp. UIC10630]|nr:hypothetical protein [Nostoc sp. UIC 10630]